MNFHAQPLTEKEAEVLFVTCQLCLIASSKRMLLYSLTLFTELFGCVSVDMLKASSLTRVIMLQIFN